MNVSSAFLSFVCVGAVLFCVASSARADESLRELQSTLKTKGYYYGDVTGVPDQETRDALRRCQIHEGLPVTGELDNATAKALNLARTRAPNTSPTQTLGTTTALPNSAKPEPTRRSASAMPPAEVDREYLRQLDQPAPTTRPNPSPLPRFVNPTVPATPLSPASKILSPGNNNGSAPLAEIEAFVRNYVAIGSEPDVYAELALYADTVDYFDSGRISRRAVLRDMQSYRRQWTERAFVLEGKPTITDYTGQSARVRFRLSFQVRNSKAAVNGRIESTLDLRRAPNGRFEIVAVKEAKLPRL